MGFSADSSPLIGAGSPQSANRGAAIRKASTSEEYWWATSNWIGCNRWGLLEPTLFASVLDSGDLVFCFVLNSESARKQGVESRSLLDPNSICFGDWIWARRPVHLRMDAL